MPELKLAGPETSKPGLPAWFDQVIGNSILQYGQRLAARNYWSIPWVILRYATIARTGGEK